MKHFGILALVVVLALVGCSQDSGKADVAGDVELWEDELPIRDPWLRDRMPDDVLLYLRLPNLFGLLATPKGNVLDTALRSRTNVENVQKIRAGLADNLLPLMPVVASQITLFERYVSSPVEIAGTFLPAPSALVAVTLSVESDCRFRKPGGRAWLLPRGPARRTGGGPTDRRRRTHLCTFRSR